MIFRSTLPEFWEKYNHLPEDIQRRADKQFRLFAANPRHPSLQLKPVGEFWSVQVTDAHRALAIREQNILTWFWIGSHDEYEQLIKWQNRRIRRSRGMRGKLTVPRMGLHPPVGECRRSEDRKVTNPR